MDGQSCDWSGRFISTGCLLVLTFCFSVSVSALAVGPDMFVGWFGVEVSRGFGFSQRAYMKRFSPAPSSHCGHCTLILCSDTLDPRIQRCMAHTKMMAIILLMFPKVLEYGCCHIVVRLLANLLRVAPAYTPSIPSTEATKGEKC